MGIRLTQLSTGLKVEAELGNIQPPEGWASSPSEGGFMGVGGGRGVGIRMVSVCRDQGKHKDGLVYSMSNPLVKYTGWM